MIASCAIIKPEGSMEKMYNSAELAELTGRKPVTIRKLAAEYGLGQKVGRDWVFTDQDIEKIKQVPRVVRPSKKNANDE